MRKSNGSARMRQRMARQVYLNLAEAGLEPLQVIPSLFNIDGRVYLKCFIHFTKLPATTLEADLRITVRSYAKQAGFTHLKISIDSSVETYERLFQEASD